MSPYTYEVLVTGGHTRPGLAVARSLAERGVSVVVTGSSREMALRSRYVHDGAVGPSSADDPGAFIEFIHRMVARYGVRLVIPLTDPDILALELHRGLFEPAVKLATADSQALRRTMNKRLNLAIAREHDVPCPRQFELESPEQIPEMIEHLGFPIVLKNPGPTFDPEMPPPPFRVLYARDETELRRLVARYHGHGAPPLYQECAEGTVHNVCCFAARGEIVAVHEYHSIRRFLGQGVLRRVTGLTPELERSAHAMMKAVEWDGPAHLGFFVSQDRRRIWYMETNGRFWGSVQGSIDAGWDFPYWTYRYFLRGDVPQPGPLRVGSLSCWHRGDLEALAQYLRGGEVPATGTRPGRMTATLQCLSAMRPGVHSDVFRWSDPLPAVIDHYRFLHNAWDFARRRTLGRRKAR